MQHSPTPRRGLFAGLLAIALATLSTITPAQTIPRQPMADSTHTYRNLGVPQNTAPTCTAGTVLSGGQCVTLNNNTGATVLPYELPAGAYTNGAGYPLIVQITGRDFCEAYLNVHANGVWQTVARGTSVDSSTSCSATGIVPPHSSFSVGDDSVATRVTALSNNAKWEHTGIGFTGRVLVHQWTSKNGDCTYRNSVWDLFYSLTGAYQGRTTTSEFMECDVG